MKSLFLIAILFSSFNALACTYTTSTTTESTYEIIRQARNGGRVSLCVDDKKFYDFQLENMLEAGVRLRILMSQVDYYNFQLENFAKKGSVLIDMGRKQMYPFQIEDLLEAGATVRLSSRHADLYSFQILDLAKASPGRLILVLDDDRYYDHEIRQFREAGVRIVIR